MQIITPMEPTINSANVSRSALKLIQTRLDSGLQISENIQRGDVTWSELFRPPGFFREHEDFVVITAGCEGDHLLWFGLIESHLKHLRDHIERGFVGAWIWPKGFVGENDMPFRKMWFIGLRIPPGCDTDTLKQPLNIFKDQVTRRIPLSSVYQDTMQVTAHHVLKEEIANLL